MCVHEAEDSAVLPVNEEKITWDSPEGAKPQACSPLWASRQTQSPLPDFSAAENAAVRILATAA